MFLDAEQRCLQFVLRIGAVSLLGLLSYERAVAQAPLVTGHVREWRGERGTSELLAQPQQSSDERAGTACMGPALCERFALDPTGSSARHVFDIRLEPDSGHSSRTKHVLVGAGIGAGSALAAILIFPPKCTGGGDDGALCGVAMFVVTGFVTAGAALVGGVVGAFWPTQ
jgi:hypothetical protein